MAKKSSELKPLSKDQLNKLANRQEVKLPGSESAPTIYANNVNISLSPWDLRMRFGQVEDASPERLSYRDLVTVYMSPQHAKAFSRLLAEKVAQYEQLVQFHTETVKALDGAETKDG